MVELTNDPEAVLIGMQKAQEKALHDNADLITHVETCNGLIDKEQTDLSYLEAV